MGWMPRVAGRAEQPPALTVSIPSLGQIDRLLHQSMPSGTPSGAGWTVKQATRSVLVYLVISYLQWLELLNVSETLFELVCWKIILDTLLYTRLKNGHIMPWQCPSVCPSVTPFWLCSHHRIIMKFSGVITSDKSDVHAKGQGQRSKVKVTEVTTQLNRFRTITPVWIHIWWWNDAYSLIMLRRGALLFFKVICQISRSHGSKNRRIWPRLGVSGL